MVFERFFNFFEDAGCPPPPEPTKEQLNTEAANLIKSAGIRSCETSQESMTAEAHASVDIGFVEAEAGMSMTSNKSSSIGCEQIAVITDKYRKAVNSTTCLLKETKNITKNSVAGVNSIVFEATNGSLDVSCSGQEGLSIRQGMSLEMISQINLSQTELTKIETACKDVVKTIAESAMSSENGLGATPQGQKLIKDTLTDIQQNDYKASIAKTLNESISEMQGRNTVLFKAGKDVRINGSRCVFEQDMIIKMVASSTVDSTLSDMMSTMSDTLNESTTEASATAKNRGADDLAKAVKSGPKDNTNMLIAAVILVVILVIGGIAYVMMNKSDSQPQYAQPYPQPYPQPQYSQPQYAQPPQMYPQYPPAGRVRGSSYSPLIKHDIDPKYIFAAILLAIIYFSKRKENYAEEKVYDF